MASDKPSVMVIWTGVGEFTEIYWHLDGWLSPRIGFKYGSVWHEMDGAHWHLDIASDREGKRIYLSHEYRSKAELLEMIRLRVETATYQR